MHFMPSLIRTVQSHFVFLTQLMYCLFAYICCLHKSNITGLTGGSIWYI